MTSGNMGAGLAVVCQHFGNPFHAFMSQGNSPERCRDDARTRRLHVVLVPQVNGRPGLVTGDDIAAAAAAAQEAKQTLGAFYVDQFNNPRYGESPRIGAPGQRFTMRSMARLRLSQPAVGSGGTFSRCGSSAPEHVAPVSNALRSSPEGAEALARGKLFCKPTHVMQGTSYGFVPPLFDHHLVNGFLAVSDEEAILYKQRLAQQEYSYVGYSSGANVCAAIKLIESGLLGENPVVVTILCDTGLKYSGSNH